MSRYFIAAGTPLTRVQAKRADDTDPALFQYSVVQRLRDAQAKLDGEIATTIEVLASHDLTEFPGTEHVQLTFAATTSDDTPLDVFILPLDDPGVYTLEASRVQARNLAGGEQAAWMSTQGAAVRDGGGASIPSGSQAEGLIHVGALPWTVEWVAAGDNAILRITGEAAKVIDWTGTISYQKA